MSIFVFDLFFFSFNVFLLFFCFFLLFFFFFYIIGAEWQLSFLNADDGVLPFSFAIFIFIKSIQQCLDSFGYVKLVSGSTPAFHVQMI